MAVLCEVRDSALRAIDDALEELYRADDWVYESHLQELEQSIMKLLNYIAYQRQQIARGEE